MNLVHIELEFPKKKVRTVGIKKIIHLGIYLDLNIYWPVEE